jgi:hypothetical protein
MTVLLFYSALEIAYLTGSNHELIYITLNLLCVFNLSLKKDITSRNTKIHIIELHRLCYNK